MELDIDFSIKSKYGDYHYFYAQNLKIFRSFLKVFENFFKKEKYQHSEVKIDEDSKDTATIKFCSKKYQLALFIDPANLESARFLLAKMDQDRLTPLGGVVIEHSENLIFPENNKISIKDEYEFNHAVLNFFIASITKNTDEKISTQ